MKFLVTQPKNMNGFKTFFTKQVLNELEKYGEIIYNLYDRKFSKEEFIENLKDIDVVFTGWGSYYKFDKEILANANKLKIIAHTGGSIAKLYSEELLKRNIVVLSGNKFFAESVAEGTLCYILLGQRKLIDQINETANMGWVQSYYHTKGLKNKTIGIIGFGMVAKSFVRILQSFDVKIKIFADYFINEDISKYNAQICSLEEIFKTCDIISVHLGLTEKNYHLIDKKLLEVMKDDALIVNTARGAIINEEDLAKELKKGKIRAVLDVYEKEPLPINSELRGLKNAVLIPHKAGVTTDVRELITLALIKDIKKYKNGSRELEYAIPFEYVKYMTDETFLKK